MRRPLLALLVSIAAPACETDDPYPYRPPGGGGTGSSTDAPDAGRLDAAPADAGAAQLAGRVCVIRDVASPFECPVDEAAAGVQVTAVASAALATSDDLGDFVIDLTVVPDVLEVGAGPVDGLVTTRSASDLTGPPVNAPALDAVRYQGILDSLGELQTTGAMLVYVRDDAGAVPGATVTAPGRVIYYDDGAGEFLIDAVSTGPDGIALVLDTGSATVTAVEGARAGSAPISTVTNGVGVGVIVLPPR